MSHTLFSVPSSKPLPFRNPQGKHNKCRCFFRVYQKCPFIRFQNNSKTLDRENVCAWSQPWACHGRKHFSIFAAHFIRNHNPHIKMRSKWKNNCIFKIKFLKWIAILCIQGLTRAAKNEICLAIRDGDPLN